MKDEIKLSGITAFLCVLAPLTVSAHTLWVNCTDYTPEFSARAGAKTKIYMGWGHHFPVDSFVKAEDFTDIIMLAPSKKMRR